MPCGIRALALSLCVSAALAGHPAAVRAQAELEPPPAPEAPAPPFTFLLDLGPSFGWFAGGQLGLGFAFRMTDRAALVITPRLAGGQGWDDNPFVVLGGDLGVRLRRMAEVSGVGHLGVGVNYMVEIEGPRTDYLYVAPHLRAGGGLRLGAPGRRFGWGVEGTLRLGYAFDVTNHALELADVDYGGLFGAFEVALVMEF